MSATPPPKGLRCFVAVPLPAEVREALFATIGLLGRDLPPDVRWQRKLENLHLTLAFLGNIAEDRVRALAGALPGLMEGIAPFSIEVRGLGAFPSARRANVLWAGVDDALGSLARIAGRVGPESDPREAARPFRAHVTLGRSKAGVDARAAVERLADTTFGGATVAEVHLYESRLAREGSTYTVLARAPLRKTG